MYKYARPPFNQAEGIRQHGGTLSKAHALPPTADSVRCGSDRHFYRLGIQHDPASGAKLAGPIPTNGNSRVHAVQLEQRTLVVEGNTPAFCPARMACLRNTHSIGVVFVNEHTAVFRLPWRAFRTGPFIPHQHANPGDRRLAHQGQIEHEYY